MPQAVTIGSSSSPKVEQLCTAQLSQLLGLVLGGAAWDSTEPCFAVMTWFLTLEVTEGSRRHPARQRSTECYFLCIISIRYKKNKSILFESEE
jgi:hypothetical protein